MHFHWGFIGGDITLHYSMMPMLQMFDSITMKATSFLELVPIKLTTLKCVWHNTFKTDWKVESAKSIKVKSHLKNVQNTTYKLNIMFHAHRE